LVDPDAGPFRDTQELKSNFRPTYCVRAETIALANICMPNKKLIPVVKERLGQSFLPWLELGIKIPGVSASPTDFQYIGPANAVENLIKGTGLIANCSHDLHDETGPVARLVAGHLPFRLPSQATVDIKHPNGEMVVTVFRGDTNTALIAACGCWLPLFLRPENCVVCAIHIGIRHSWANFAIVCSEESWNQVSLLFIEPSVAFVNSFRAEAKGSLRKVMRGTAIFMEINE
jgi:hypothetical protein